MSSHDKRPPSSNYWQQHYLNPANVVTGTPQANVGRTINGQPIDAELWKRTVDDLVLLLQIDQNSDVLELCCGNGRLIGPLSAQSRAAYGVDFSAELIEQLKLEFGSRVQIQIGDVLDLDWEPETLDVVILYFSIQHFTEAESIRLIQRSLKWLRLGGRLLIGDVPDAAKKWNYLREASSRIDYLQRILDGRPKIGQWYEREFFGAMNDFLPNVKVGVIDQPPHHFNSGLRFDVLITKVAS